MSVQVVKGSILDFDGDAIVNAANGFLMHGAGLAKVIDTAARDEGRLKSQGDRVETYLREQRQHSTIATGNVGVTSAGALPYKGIIHAVGPVWNGGHFYERWLLRSAYAEACAAAYQRRWLRIAVPALSVGLFGYPPLLAAQDTARALVGFWTDPQPDGVELDVTVYLFDPDADKLDNLYRLYTKALA